MSTTPNMGLILPTVSSTPGPQWASQIVTALEEVDEHDHTAGKGARIVTNALNIDGDLSFNGHKAKSLELATFADLTAFPTGSGDVRATLSRSGDLYWNNGSGIAVKLTDGNRVNVGPITGTNAFGYRSLSAGNLSINVSDTFSYIDVDTSTAHSIFLPSAAGVTGGRYYIVKDRTGNASTSSITMSPNGTDTIEPVGNTSFIINGDFDCYAFISDGTGSYRAMHLLDGEFERGNFYRPTTGIRFQGLVTGEALFNDPLRFGAATMTVTASSQLSDPRPFAHQVVHLIGTASAATSITVPGQSGWMKTVRNHMSATNGLNTVSLALSGTSVLIPEDTFVPVWTSGTAGNVRLYGGFNSRTMPPGPPQTFATWLKFDEQSGATTFKNNGNAGAASSDWIVISGSADCGYPGIQRLATRFDGHVRTILGSLNDSNNPSGHNFRVSAWIKPFWNNDAHREKMIVTKRFSSLEPVWALGLCISGTMTGTLSASLCTADAGGNVPKYLLSPINVDFAAWNHVGLTFNQSEQAMRLWLNGCQVRSLLVTGTITSDTTSARFMAGAIDVGDPLNPKSSAQPFCGFIDDLRYEVSSSSAPAGAGDPSTFANAARFFADAYRRGMGWFDDVGSY